MNDMITPILNQRTAKDLETFLSDPKPSLLLIGNNGIGKTTIANYLVENVLGKKNLKQGIDFLLLSPEDNTISIDSVRHIMKFIKLKTTGNRRYRRAIIIEHSEKMSNEAQNALLKLLEEPPLDTFIVLTVNSKSSLLPTVLSRLSQIEIRKMNEKKLLDHLISLGFKSEDIRLSLLASNNLIGESIAILNKDSIMTIDILNLSKAILVGDKYSRLIQINDLTKDKTKPKILLLALSRIISASLKNAAQKNNIASIDNWNRMLDQVSIAQDALEKNANPKLTLTKLFLNI
jgi:DNA polymerase-3 subunit delta'